MLSKMKTTMRLLGEIITETCNLNQDVINQALALQRRNGFRLGEILIEQNIISEPDLHHALALQSAGPDFANGDQDELAVRLPIWFKLLLVSALMGGVSMVGIWFLSGLLLSLFTAFGQ